MEGILSADFERRSSAKDQEHQEGTLHLSARGWWRVDSRVPVVQTVVSTDSLTWVLYPQKETGLRIHTPLLAPPGPVLFFAVALQSNDELLESGMRVVDFTVRGDSTVTSLQPAGVLAREFPGVLRIVRVGKDVARLEMEDATGHAQSFVVEERTTWKGAGLPTLLRVERWQDGALVRETVRYRGFRAEAAADGKLFAPEVPASWAVEERYW